MRKRFKDVNEVNTSREESGDLSMKAVNFERNLKKAITSLKDHPLKVFDVQSAMLIKGVGPSVAQFIQSELFSRYPPRVPVGEELEQFERGRKSLTQEEKVKAARVSTMDSLSNYKKGQTLDIDTYDSLMERTRPKRRKGKESSLVSLQGPRTAEGCNSWIDAADGDLQPKKRTKKQKEYIPGLGTANYAFMIVLYIAQKGYECLEYLTKAELMDRAEASGLSTKPIHPDGSRIQGNTNNRAFYSGWSSFKIVMNHNLAYTWGRPMKVSLTSKGVDLACKLYKDAVSRGKLSPSDGINMDDPDSSRRNSGTGVQPAFPHCTIDVPPTVSRPPSKAGRGPEAGELNLDLSERWALSQGEAMLRTSGSGSQSMHQGQRTAPFAMSQGVDVVSCLSEDEDDLEMPTRQSNLTGFESQGASESASGHLKSRVTARPLPPGRHVGTVSAESELPPLASCSMNISQESNTFDQQIRLPPVIPGTSFEQAYDLVILVDEREQYENTMSTRSESRDFHKRRLENKGNLVESRSLPIGDLLWIARRKTNPAEQYVLDYVVERKRMDDLIQSIRSGRYYDQKYRLRACGLVNIFYLVEGAVESLPSSSDHKAVCTACAKTSTIDGFRVVRTKSVSETLRVYHGMTSEIASLCSREYKKALEHLPIHHSLCIKYNEFCNHCHNMSKGMTTLKDLWVLMLCGLPGLGPEVASAIVKAYPTPLSLWKEYKKQQCVSVTAAEHLLSPIQLRRGRTVGFERSKKVYQLLFRDTSTM